jgi:hypothetical protein
MITRFPAVFACEHEVAARALGVEDSRNDACMSLIWAISFARVNQWPGQAIFKGHGFDP